MSEPPRRIPTAQSPRSLRVGERRRNNHLDPGGWTTLLDLTGPLVVEASADWSQAYFVSGYDDVSLFADFTKGSADGFRVAMQVARSQSSVDANWFDYYFDEAGDGLLVRKVYAHDPAGDVRVVWSFPVAFPQMRFKLWGTGASLASSAAKLHAARHMRAP